MDIESKYTFILAPKIFWYPEACWSGIVLRLY